MSVLRLNPANETLTEAKGPVSQINSQVFPGLGSIDSVHGEVDDVLADMKEFHRAQPDQVMAAVSAHSARLTEIAVHVGRIEVQYRQWKPVGQEVDKVISALREQFQVASRLIAVRQLDQDLLRGST